MKKAVLSCLLLGITIIASYAAPYTTIGQLSAPDAYILPHKTAEITFTNYFRRAKSDFVGLPEYEYVPFGMINIGLFDRIGLAGCIGDKLGFVDLKLKLLEETPSLPQISIGVDNLLSPVREDASRITLGQNFFDNPDKTMYEKNSPYICMSKAYVLRNLTGLKLLETHMTAGIGRNKFQAQTNFSKRFEGLFGSISAKPHKNLGFTFEFNGNDFAVGGQYSYKNFALKLSYVDLEEQENNRFAVGLSYLFDKFADSRRKDIGSVNSWQATETGNVNPELNESATGTNTDLLEELKKLREQREQAQKVLDDLRNQLKDIEESEN